jgi:hypothetical protein
MRKISFRGMLPYDLTGIIHIVKCHFILINNSDKGETLLSVSLESGGTPAVGHETYSAPDGGAGALQAGGGPRI